MGGAAPQLRGVSNLRGVGPGGDRVREIGDHTGMQCSTISWIIRVTEQQLEQTSLCGPLVLI